MGALPDLYTSDDWQLGGDMKTYKAALLLIPALLVAGGGAALVGYFVVGWSHQAASSPTRIIVTDQGDTDARIVTIVVGLRAKGFQMVTSSEASKLPTAGARSVVFTPAALRATPRDVLQSLHGRGVVVAAVDVRLPDLRIAADPQAATDAGDSIWISPAPSDLIYSIIRKVSSSNQGRISQSSDILRDVDAFIGALAHAESTDVQQIPPPVTPPPGTTPRPR